MLIFKLSVRLHTVQHPMGCHPLCIIIHKCITNWYAPYTVDIHLGRRSFLL